VPEFTVLDEQTRDKYAALGAIEDTEVCAGNVKPLDHIASEDRFTIDPAR
jgi:hypothetical protein